MNFSKSSYNEWLRNWINVYKKPYIKTWKLIKEHIKCHVPKSLLSTRLCSLNAFDVQKAINNVKTSRMRLEMYDIYHSSLKCAYKLGFLERDISDSLIKPRHVRKIGTALNDGELCAFLYLVRNSPYRIFEFLLFTGCRRSEALNVTWNDIFLHERVIHIRGTKTEKSDRYVPIFDDLYNMLIDMPVTNGKLFHYKRDFVTHKFKDFCKNHKLHDLRHTFATKCMESGISINVVQLWLGHTRLDTTARIYTHVQRDFALNESKKFKLFN